MKIHRFGLSKIIRHFQNQTNCHIFCDFRYSNPLLRLIVIHSNVRWMMAKKTDVKIYLFRGSICNGTTSTSQINKSSPFFSTHFFRGQTQNNILAFRYQDLDLQTNFNISSCHSKCFSVSLHCMKSLNIQFKLTALAQSVPQRN